MKQKMWVFKLKILANQSQKSATNVCCKKNYLNIATSKLRYLE